MTTGSVAQMGVITASVPTKKGCQPVAAWTRNKENRVEAGGGELVVKKHVEFMMETKTRKIEGSFIDTHTMDKC